MHGIGRIQRDCKRRSGGGGGGQHMPATITRRTVAAGDSPLVSTVTADSFCKVLPWRVFSILPDFLSFDESSVIVIGDLKCPVVLIKCFASQYLFLHCF